MGARVEGFQMDEGEDRIDLVRAACWKLCDAKDSCGSAPLCEGWGGVDEWRGERDDDWKGIGVVDDINESVANIFDCGVGNKMAGGCTTSRSAIDLRSHEMAHITRGQKERLSK